MDETLRAFVAAQAANDLLRFRLQRHFKVASPAAGAEFSVVNTGGIYWELLAVNLVFTSSAVVANRVPNLLVTDPDGVTAGTVNAIASVAASQNFRISYMEMIRSGYTSQGNRQSLPVPLRVVPPGYIITSFTSNIDVGDQYSGISVVVREWSAGQIAQHMEKVLADTFALRIADREI